MVRVDQSERKEKFGEMSSIFSAKGLKKLRNSLKSFRKNKTNNIDQKFVRANK